jgi:esterase/lipase
MKKWRGILLAILLVSLPVLSACDLLGTSSSKDKEREYYEQQLKAFQQVQEANQKAQEAYNESLKKGLEDYLKAWQKYQQQVQQQQIAQIEAAEKAKTGN